MYRAFYFSLIELASLWFALVIMEEMALWQREGRSSSCGAGLLHPIGEMMSLVHPFCKGYISFFPEEEIEGARRVEGPHE